MAYLKEFQTQIIKKDFSKFLLLWEEYCTNDSVDVPEFLEFLHMVKSSDFAKPFGKFVETALPLWNLIQSEQDSYEVMKSLIDLENTNSPLLGDIALKLIKQKFETDPKFNDRLRLVGLRSQDNFQGAIRNYELLAHFNRGNFVFHTGGWGTGEIIDISEIIEQLTIEFENVGGKKHITYANAFKTLYPLKHDSFLARRFSDPDKLEEEARKDPVAIITLLLKDLGPKTASEIKDELEELVIPTKDWAKWWSSARTKLKKEPLIESPESSKDPFRIRTNAMTHEERLGSAIQDNSSIDETILSSYNLVRDFPDILKKADVKASLLEKIEALRQQPHLSDAQELQIRLFLETMLNSGNTDKTAASLIEQAKNPAALIQNIDILALKKQALVLAKQCRSDWTELFLDLFFKKPLPSNLRDYILKELLCKEGEQQLIAQMDNLRQHPGTNPELFVWYFSKIASDLDPSLPYGDKSGAETLFESFLTLYHHVEQKGDAKDLLKKMYNLLSGKRFEIVRKIIQGTDEAYLKEILLLASKCQSLNDHDKSTLRSLAAVVQPTLQHEKDKKKKIHLDTAIFWTTEEGYKRIQERCQRIATVEVVENSREVEAARALGDLRENSEYKFACEKRSRLQNELRTLSDQLKKARIITPHDIDSDEVGIGSVVTVKDSTGKTTTYTILGAWDADVDKGILSLQSKLAEAMLGAKIGDVVTFKGEELIIQDLASFFSRKQ